MIKVFILILLTICSWTFSHIALEFPTPRNPNSGIKTYPCGSDAFFGSGQVVTQISPGPLTIRWGETINHFGAPYRIALSVGGDSGYDNFILVDHIPHNDPGGGSFANPKPHQFTVCIPDIDCQQCSLQLINAMTDKIGSGTCCPYPPGEPGACFSVYHSCANIRINGTQSPATYLNTHTNPARTAVTGNAPYGREAGNWVLDSMSNTYYLPNGAGITFNPGTCSGAAGAQSGISYASSEMLSVCGTGNFGGTRINQVDFLSANQAGTGGDTTPATGATGTGITNGGGGGNGNGGGVGGTQMVDNDNNSELSQNEVLMTAGLLAIVVPAACLLIVGASYYFFVKRAHSESDSFYHPNPTFHDK